VFNRRILLASMATLPLATPALARAHGYKAGDIQIGHPWSRAAPSGITGVGYLTLMNNGTTADRLLGARADIAVSAEIHQQTEEGGIMRMRPVQGIDLPPGVLVKLEPNGFHIMLIGLKQAMAKDDRVPMTLIFQKAGEVRVELEVKAAGARGGGHHHSG
jgi:copper(I)-binding protein